MSTNLAYSLPSGSPESPRPTRQIEIVTSRDQRRARPRIAYAMIAVGGLFVIFMAQLGLSIALSNGAYQISSLSVEQRDLGRVENSLTEDLQIVASQQNLAANAQNLGMVSSNSPVYLSMADGRVTGTGAAAAAAAPGSSSAIANSLLASIPLVGSTGHETEDDGSLGATVVGAEDAVSGLVGAESASVLSATDATAQTPTTGAPATGSVIPSVPSVPEGIPSPITH